MAVIENLTQFKEILSPSKSADFRANLDQSWRDLQDRQLSNSNIDCGLAILTQVENPQFNSHQKNIVLRSFFLMMLGKIKEHSSFHDIEMVQIDPTHAINQSGAVVELTDGHEKNNFLP